MSPSGTKILLFVNDDTAERQLLAALAARAGWRATCVADSLDACAMLNGVEGAMIDAIIVDQLKAGGDDAALVRRIRDCCPDLPILLLAARAPAAAGAAALRAGATDFLVKPLTTERLNAALDAATGDYAGARELRPLCEKPDVILGFDQIVGAEPDFRSALAIAAKASRGRMPILIEGEPGTGRECVARAVHATGPRARRPFVIARCRSIPANLVTSHLFGHVQGSFAGAFEERPGLIAEADGGTLMIDDLGALPAEAQCKLAQFLETGRATQIGGATGQPRDVRIIAASSINAAEAIAEGSLREDLYFRLASVPVKLPPLRARRPDIPVLARHLLARICEARGCPPIGIADAAVNMLLRHGWPGNVRQLHDALFRATALAAGDMLTPLDFPQIAIENAGLDSGTGEIADGQANAVRIYQSDGHLRPLDEIEADVIRLAIGHYRGRMTEVAR